MSSDESSDEGTPPVKDLPSDGWRSLSLEEFLHPNSRPMTSPPGPSSMEGTAQGTGNLDVS